MLDKSGSDQIMGAFYGSVQIRSEDRGKIKAAAEQVAAAMKIDMLIGPAVKGWIGVYPENHGQDERVGAEMAKLVEGYVMHLLLHDEDIFAYWLHRDGKLIDSYNSTPGYFGAKNRAAEMKMIGQPEMFRPIIGEKVERLAKILDRSEPRPTFMSEKMEAFAELLEIPHAMLSYEYILEGEMLEEGERERFEEIWGGGGKGGEADVEITPNTNDPYKLIEKIKDPAKRHYLTGQVRIWRQNDWTGALDDFDRAIDLKPDFVEALNLRGLALKRLGDLPGALRDFEKTIELEPENGEHFRNRGDVRLQRNDLAGALADYDRSIQLNPDEPDTWNNRGFVKKKLGDLPGALADLDQAIELHSEFTAAFKNRGDVKRAMKDFKAALADYDVAIGLQPSNAITFNSRGLCKSAMGDLDGAMADYDRAIKLGPKPNDLEAIQRNREKVVLRKKEL